MIFFLSWLDTFSKVRHNGLRYPLLRTLTNDFIFRTSSKSLVHALLAAATIPKSLISFMYDIIINKNILYINTHLGTQSKEKTLTRKYITDKKTRYIKYV